MDVSRGKNINALFENVRPFDSSLQELVDNPLIEVAEPSRKRSREDAFLRDVDTLAEEAVVKDAILQLLVTHETADRKLDFFGIARSVLRDIEKLESTSDAATYKREKDSLQKAKADFIREILKCKFRLKYKTITNLFV